MLTGSSVHVQCWCWTCCCILCFVSSRASQISTICCRLTSYTILHQEKMQKGLIYLQCKAACLSDNLNRWCKPVSFAKDQEGVEVRVDRSPCPFWNKVLYLNLTKLIQSNKCRDVMIWDENVLVCKCLKWLGMDFSWDNCKYIIPQEIRWIPLTVNFKTVHPKKIQKCFLDKETSQDLTGIFID